MPIEIKMPALSPTMEEGTLSRWLVKEGDAVKAGDLMAEIETDKATMEFEAVDEGVVGRILVAEGTDGVKVGTVIMLLQGEDEPVEPEPSSPLPAGTGQGASAPPGEGESVDPAASPSPPAAPRAASAASSGRKAERRVKASPLARRIAADKGIDLASLGGSGPNGRVIRADVDGARPSIATTPVARVETVAPSTPAAVKPAQVPDIPHEATKLSNMRKTIARRLTESKQQVPHIYLTVDVRLDALLKLRGDLNHTLAQRGVKLSVNDLLIKALAVALIHVPKCNVMYTPDQLISFQRADISVAVSTPGGLITPIITGADSASLSSISTRMKDLAARARDNKLAPHEFTGGTASISNMGMFGIKQFEAVINPPQGMILAIGAGEKRPWVMPDATLGIASIMSATGSFDHRAIDGADGAQLMQAFRDLVESPLGMLA